MTQQPSQVSQPSQLDDISGVTTSQLHTWMQCIHEQIDDTTGVLLRMLLWEIHTELVKRGWKPYLAQEGKTVLLQEIRHDANTTTTQNPDGPAYPVE